MWKKTFIDEVDFYREELFCRSDDILIKFVSDLRIIIIIIIFAFVFSYSF
jgi:hypothetical protein